MRASTATKLPLARWAQMFGIQPLHVMGVDLQSLTDAHCEHVWPEHSWQDADAISREDVLQAIAQAEADLEQHLGYRLLPSWEVEEWHELPKPNRPEVIATGLGGARGYNVTVAEGDWGYFLSGGVRTKTLISAAAAVAYSDTDSDSYLDRAQVTAPTTVTDPQEIAIYYPGKNGDDEWQIRPIEVTIADGVETISFRRELAVIEAALEGFAFEAIEGTDNAKFLTTVDVYRVANDPQIQASLMWEPLGSCDCGGATCPVCQFSTQPACFHSRGDPRLSHLVLSPATWNATTAQFDAAALAVGRRPDQARLWYRAGWRDKRLARPMIEMDRDLALAVAVYAASMLARSPCDCRSDVFDHWRKDLAFSGGAEELATYNLSARDLDNPLGTRAGAVFAWRRLRRQQTVHVPIGRGVLA